MAKKKKGAAKKQTVITADRLMDMSACQSGVEHFEKLFKGGEAAITVANVLKAIKDDMEVTFVLESLNADMDEVQSEIDSASTSPHEVCNAVIDCLDEGIQDEKDNDNNRAIISALQEIMDSVKAKRDKLKKGKFKSSDRDLVRAQVYTKHILANL